MLLVKLGLCPDIADAESEARSQSFLTKDESQGERVRRGRAHDERRPACRDRLKWHVGGRGDRLPHVAVASIADQAHNLQMNAPRRFLKDLPDAISTSTLLLRKRSVL